MSEHTGRGLHRLLMTGSAVMAIGALALGGAALPATAAQAEPGLAGVRQDLTGGRYIVTLIEDAASVYEGGSSDLVGTAPDEGDQLDAGLAPVTRYSDYLERQQEAVADSVGARIDASYTLAVNAFAAELTAEQATSLTLNRKVASIVPNELLTLAATPSTEFLGLSGAGGVWEQLGGTAAAGDGVVIGVLDTGIAPENPAFAGAPLGTRAGAEPYRNGDQITYAKADGGTFIGGCQTGEQFGVEDCTTKVISARFFIDGFGEDNIGDASTGEYVSPRDGDGHGSHTASTAAGNVGTPASIGGIDFGSYTGVAPAAKIAVYKVCWSGPDVNDDLDDGCSTQDILSAIDAAVAEGVDVINYSIGGGAAESTFTVIDEAFLGAAAAGVFVSASAGNDGPDDSTVDNASPWITTVAATTIPSYEGTVTLGDGAGAFAGASITLPMDGTEIAGDLVRAADVAAADGTDSALCAPGSLDDTLVTETTIVVCERGTYARVAKSDEVARVGGLAMVMVNTTEGSIDTDFHSVPSVHLDAVHHDAIWDYAATEGATATLRAGNSTESTPPTPQVAGFSSRGPVLPDGQHLLKPDIAAPGVSILAAGPNPEDGPYTSQFLSGTSMAAPHIAGLAALYFGEHPNASPMEVKSAMMTTAYDTFDAWGESMTEPFAQGAGQVDPTEFLNPGLVYLTGRSDWLGYIQWLGYQTDTTPVPGYELNLPSIAHGALLGTTTIHRTLTATRAGTWTAEADLLGIDVIVEPETVTFDGAGDTQEVALTFTRTDAPVEEFTTGFLTWDGPTLVRSPIAIQPLAVGAPHDAEGTGVTGSTDVTITPGWTGDLRLASTGLIPGTVQGEAVAVDDEHYFYDVTVPADTVVARFDLNVIDDALEDPVDFDLFVYLLNSDGEPVALWQSATGAADERIDLDAPEAGAYRVEVHAYDTVRQDVGFELTTASVVPGGAPVAFAPPVLAAEQATPVTFTASWAGLAPHTTYLAAIQYDDTEVYTVLQVRSGEPLPVAPVNTVAPRPLGLTEVGRTLTADPGLWDTEGLTYAFQWRVDGADIPGATSKNYTVRATDQGKAVSVAVTATKTGRPSGAAESAGRLVKWVTTSVLTVQPSLSFWQPASAVVFVDSALAAPPTGTVVILFNGKQVGTASLIDGVARYSLAQVRPGTVIGAEYLGDAVNGGSQSNLRTVDTLFF